MKRKFNKLYACNLVLKVDEELGKWGIGGRYRLFPDF
jgi:hypothetical protein